MKKLFPAMMLLLSFFVGMAFIGPSLSDYNHMRMIEEKGCTTDTECETLLTLKCKYISFEGCEQLRTELYL